MLTITNQLVHQTSRLHLCLKTGAHPSSLAWPFRETIIRDLKTQTALSAASKSRTKAGTGPGVVVSVKARFSTKTDPSKAKTKVTATKTEAATPTPLDVVATTKSSVPRVRSTPKKNLEPPTPTTSLSGAPKKSASTTREKKTAKRSTVSAVRRVATLSTAASARPVDSLVLMAPPFLSSSLQDQGRVVTSTATITTSGRANGSSQIKVVIREEALRKSSSGTTGPSLIGKARPSASSVSALSLTAHSKMPVTLSHATAVLGENNPSAPLPFLDFRTNDSREVMYTKSEEEADLWLASNTTKMWAMDAEWKPFGGYKKQGKMAMVQLGNDSTVFLFHIIHMRSFPKELARILEDSRILKVGINIRGDAYKLFKDWGVACSSIVELGAISIQVQDDLSSQRSVRSMETLTRELLGHSVEKVTMTRMGNWESRSLAAHQIAYAANDAFVTYEIAEQLKRLQGLRPNQEFTLPLVTVHTNGSTTLKVRGTLQERQDRAAEASDVMDTLENPLSILPGKLLNDYPYAECNTLMMSTRLSWKPTSSGGAITAFKYGDWKLKKSLAPSTKTVKIVPKQQSASRTSTSTFPEMGGRSETIVIKAARLHGRSFSTVSSRGLFRVTECDSRKLSSSSKAGKGKAAGDSKRDIYFPSQLLPESLEGKDILERNQAVWMDAGGRDLSEDATVDDEEDSDWHLKQNQALYASLVSPIPDDGEDVDKKK